MTETPGPQQKFSERAATLADVLFGPSVGPETRRAARVVLAAALATVEQETLMTSSRLRAEDAANHLDELARVRVEELERCAQIVDLFIISDPFLVPKISAALRSHGGETR